jgi:hypothetical protein
MNRPTSARYRTPNWSSCTASLKKSGSLLILLDKEMTWLLFDGNPAGSQAPRLRTHNGASRGVMMP